jgi:hypothetical protein
MTLTSHNNYKLLLQNNICARNGGHIYNPSIHEAEAGDHKFKANLGYTERPYFKTKQKGRKEKEKKETKKLRKKKPQYSL